MKQCAHCNELYAPRLEGCPRCASSPPQAWVRTKSKVKTRQVRAVAKQSTKKSKKTRHDSKDPTPKSVVAVKREIAIPERDEPPKSLFSRSEEVDPATLDKTVEMSRAFLEEHSSDILSMVDSTDEALNPRKLIGDMWSQFQESVPTAKVEQLGETTPDDYDFEDLVAPPSERTIENILAHGRENPDEPELAPDGGFFVDLDALDQLWETSEANFEVPKPTHGPPQLDMPAVERMKLVNQIVARSRKLAKETNTPVPAPPPAPTAAPRERFRTSHEVEEWQLEGIELAAETAPAARQMKAESVWVPRLAGVGLAIVAGWAYATAQAWPVVAALAVGALALLLLGRRSG